ncbi:hypothetical protein, partial [Blautia sp.]
MVIALKDLKGRQMDYGRFRFSWTISENEENAYFVWIYKENVSIPVMISYSQCINHCMEVSFQSDNLDMESINSTRFLIFVTDSRRELSGREIMALASQEQYLINVYCGIATVKWNWVCTNAGYTLLLQSDKEIPEGLLYYEYFWGGTILRFEIPNEIRAGINEYRNLYFPELPGLPQVQTKEK